MIDWYYWLSEGWRMYRRARRVNKEGFKQYSGTAKEIAKKVVKDCWNGEFYQTSAGHFSQFWSRDFGMCTQGLLTFGPPHRVVNTLHYALSRMQTAGRVTTQLTPKGVPIDFPSYGADSLPWLVHSLHAYTLHSKNRSLLEYYEPFLQRSLEYYATLFDAETHLLKRDAHFSIIRDHYKLESPTYGNLLAFHMQQQLKELGITNPLEKLKIKQAIKKHLWNGKFFEEDLRKPGTITGDANAFALYTKILNQKEGLALIKVLQEEGLDKPFPLKYYLRGRKKNIPWYLNKLLPNYEGDTVWAHLGLCFIEGVKHYHKKMARDYTQQYAKKILEHKNFLEVYNPDGSPFMHRFYACDESMLWAAHWLTLNKNH